MSFKESGLPILLISAGILTPVVTGGILYIHGSKAAGNSQGSNSVKLVNPSSKVNDGKKSNEGNLPGNIKVINGNEQKKIIDIEKKSDEKGKPSSDSNPDDGSKKKSPTLNKNLIPTRSLSAPIAIKPEKESAESVLNLDDDKGKSSSSIKSESDDDNKNPNSGVDSKKESSSSDSDSNVDSKKGSSASDLNSSVGSKKGSSSLDSDANDDNNNPNSGASSEKGSSSSDDDNGNLTQTLATPMRLNNNDNNPNSGVGSKKGRSSLDSDANDDNNNQNSGASSEKGSSSSDDDNGNLTQTLATPMRLNNNDNNPNSDNNGWSLWGGLKRVFNAVIG